MDLVTLEKIANRFKELSSFTATARVDSAAIGPDRVICQPGDRVVVERWHCHEGPTSITINGRPRCVPFSWVLEMGAPTELAAYMPLAPDTWTEILAAKRLEG